jgi:ribosomal protein L12E/L44/L45/RPP1/RPP2
MIALAGALAVTAPRRVDAAGQPIDWLMQSTFDEDVDLVEIIKASAKGDAAAGSESWRREAAEKRRETAKEKATTTTDEEREPADVGKTATKFGKLGVILVLADVVTAAVMGKSVLGVAKSLEREMELDENGEVVEVKKVESGDWKDGIADKLMDRIKENQRIAEKGAEESED